MSEPTNAQMAEQDDMRLDAQIAEMYAEQTHWYDDPDEVVAFARWYWEGAHGIRGEFANLLDYFEKPWKWTPEYAGYKADHEAH